MTQLKSDPVKAQDALSTGWAQSPPCRLLTGSPALHPPPPPAQQGSDSGRFPGLLFSSSIRLQESSFQINPSTPPRRKGRKQIRIRFF